MEETDVAPETVGPVDSEAENGNPEAHDFVENFLQLKAKKEKKKGGYSDASKSVKLGDGFLDNCGKLKNKWRELLIRYKDRILFATDAHKSHRWTVYRKLIERGRAWLGQLPHDTAKAIAFDNAERLYGRK